MEIDRWLLDTYDSFDLNERLLGVIADLSFLSTYPIITVVLVLAIATLHAKKEYQKAMVVVAYVFVAAFILESIRAFSNWPHHIDGAMQVIVHHEVVPTDHSLLGLATYTILAQAISKTYRFQLVIYAIIIGLIAAFCRTITGVHSTTDVLIGLCIGSSIAYLYSYLNNWCDRSMERSRAIYSTTGVLS